MHTPGLLLYCILAALLLSSGQAQTENAPGPAESTEKSHSTSVAGMMNLLDLERKLIQNLNYYAKELEKKLYTVRSIALKLRTENDKAQAAMEQYLSNPINAFALIRRMHRDWTYWQLYMEQPVGEAQIEFVAEYRSELPSAVDMEEATLAIHRIQTTYDLDAAHMANGLLNGQQYNVRWNALDTYALGQYHYDQKNYAHASVWLYQSIQWLRNNSLPEQLGLQVTEVYLVYAETLIKLDRYADGLQLIEYVIDEKPSDAKLFRRKSEVEALIRTRPTVAPRTQEYKHVTQYERGCRGQFRTQAKAELYCTYNATTTPFLKLAPLKMELVRKDPYMVLYHDVISPSEISELQDMATPNLKRATVFSSERKRNHVVKTRTSKVAWIYDQFNELTIRLNARIADMTGFNLTGSELLQVMNYGLGGHYAAHFDYLNVSKNAEVVRTNGDRIATVLFYLTDVEQGGATVFPDIEQAVFPKRGSAIIWYNLKDDGEGDKNTLHAACPVIVGSKWVCNKWIRERAQLFRRPCFNQ